MAPESQKTGWGDKKQVSPCATVRKTQKLWISAIFRGFCSTFDLVASSANLLGSDRLIPPNLVEIHLITSKTKYKSHKSHGVWVKNPTQNRHM